MGKLPGYDAQLDMTTEPGIAKRNMASEAQFGADIASLGKGAMQIAKVLQDAKDFDETLREKNRMDQGVAEIMRETSGDGRTGDFDTFRQEQKAKLTALKEGIGGFSNNLTQKKFGDYADGLINQSAIKIDGIYDKKRLDHTNANLLIQGQLNKRNHNNRVLSPDGKTGKQMQEELIIAANTRGIRGHKLTADDLIKLDDWDYDRAIHDAEIGDPYAVMLEVEKGKDGEYAIQKGKKRKLIDEIKKIAQIRDKEEDIQLLKIQHATKTEYLEKEDERSIQENLELLDKGLDTKTMNKDWVEMKRASMLSPLGINATTQNSYFAEVTEKINEAEAAYKFYEDTKAADEYYRALQDAEIAVEAGKKNGLLDDSAYKMLNNRIHTKVAAEARYDVKDDLDRAIKYFKEEIKEKDGQDAAIKEYLYRVSDTDVKNLNMDKILEKIKSNYLKSVDPSFNEERFKNIKNVQLIKVGTTVINPLTMEQKILTKEGQWVTIQ